MLPKLKISSFLLRRLERVKQQCSGCLFGVFYGEGTLLLMGFNIETTIGQLNYEKIQQKLPAELDLCGLVKFGDCSDTEAHLSEVFKDVDITDNPILLQCELGTLVGLRASIFMHEKLHDIHYEVMEADQLYKDFCFARIKCNLSIYTEEMSQAARSKIQTLLKMLSSGSLAFQVSSTRIYITNTGIQGYNQNGYDVANKRINSDSFIEDLVQAVLETMKPNDDHHNNVNAKKKSANVALSMKCGAVGCNYDILNIGVLKCKTRDRIYADDGSEPVNHVLPAVNLCVQREEGKICIPLDIESMAVLYKRTRVHRMYDIFIESICRTLRLFETCIVDQLEGNPHQQCGQIFPRSYHFYPMELGHFLSCSYPDGVSDDDAMMQDKRKKLHRQFALPITRPHFRRANRCIFREGNTTAADDPLLNVHIGVRPSGLTDSKTTLVQGNYFYYHYLQSQMQDKGWGCAYRSLQTICSWFRLQGYTDHPVPTHLEIQKYLVCIGDKPQMFAGSTQWIGSTEVNLYLYGCLNVTSKIQHLTSGAKMAEMGPELSVHFQTQGSPIMIGGGVLAHTIIGVDHSTQTDKVKFLVLDPHYTGPDDLQSIQAKGWCGWKGAEFWDRGSFFNLCMPQRPIMF